MVRPKKHKSPILENIMNEITDKEQYITDRKMLLALKIAKALKARNLTKKQFAQMLGRKPAEISKWLTGTHNFTVETLFEIEHALSINLVDLKRKKKTKVVHINTLNLSKAGDFVKLDVQHQQKQICLA